MTESVRTMLASFNAMVAASWILFIGVGFSSRDRFVEPLSSMSVWIYWGTMLVGPVLLLGSSYPLIGKNRRRHRGNFLAVAGSLAVWCQAAVGVGPELRDRMRLVEQGFRPWWQALVWASLLSFFAAYSLYKARESDGDSWRTE